jgi:hypothetical protein
MKDLVISDVVISVEDGLYRLNDLHKAAGGENKHKPSLWLDLEQTKSYVDFLNGKSDAVIPASVSVFKCLICP